MSTPLPQPTFQPVDARADQRVAMLLDAACRVIARSGARNVRLQDVAAEAGVSKALIHYYFKSRSEVLARAYEFGDQRARLRVREEIGGLESPFERLRSLLFVYFTEERELLEDWILWSELSAAAVFEEELRPTMQTSFRTWIEWLSSLVTEAIEEGSLPRHLDPNEFAHRLTSIIDGLGSQMVRGLVTSSQARALLEASLDREIDSPAPARAVDTPPEAATGYLRLQARAVEAMAELEALASAEAAAVRTVAELVARLTASRPEVTEALTSSGVAALDSPGSRAAVGQSIAEVPTPALLVDLDRLERNLHEFQKRVDASGKAFRPHAKAHKTPELARLQLELGAVGIAVAKTSEAEVFHAAGCHDITVAFPVFGGEKWRRLAVLARSAQITVHADGELAIEGLAGAAEAEGATIGVLIEIDGGLGRSGIRPDDFDEAERLARAVAAQPALRLRGVATYRGTGYPGAAQTLVDGAGRDEAALVTRVATELRKRGIEIEQVVAGSTATGLTVAQQDGVTEVRAGAYLFYDGAQIAAGSAEPTDAALTVLTTVVSLRGRGFVTIDAGSKTLGAMRPADPAPAARALGLDAAVVRLNEEHGIVALGTGVQATHDDRLRFIPYHASAAVDLADELVLVRGDRVEQVLRVQARGKRT